ncbi:MAG TPA: enoyl-CoA hydratase-related protein [Beijerinckiaceae bacterium]|nr:enoyl-CoA hydratase-related protein [Beijerinckiaceae bacterium]
MSEHVNVARDGEVLVIRLNRPDKKNAMTRAMYDAVVEAFESADRDRLGAVLLTGSGGSFLAGNDIADFLAAAERPDEFAAFRFITALARLDTPLVAAVEGVAVGVGATLLLHCDLAYAAPNAMFRMPFVDLGLVPEAASSLLLPRRIGLAKASELLLLGEPFDANEALRLGIVNAVVPAEGLVEHALERAKKLAAKPREAIAATRRLIRVDREEVLAAMHRESVAFRQALASPAAKAAFSAFLTKAKAAAS